MTFLRLSLKPAYPRSSSLYPQKRFKGYSEQYWGIFPGLIPFQIISSISSCYPEILTAFCLLMGALNCKCIPKIEFEPIFAITLPQHIENLNYDFISCFHSLDIPILSDNQLSAFQNNEGTENFSESMPAICAFPLSRENG